MADVVPVHGVTRFHGVRVWHSVTHIRSEASPHMNSLPRAPVRNGELEYEVRGDGEPVLLVHGSLIAGAFRPLMDEPSLADYRLINYHRRGYAGSSAYDGPPEEYIERAAADAVALLEHVDAQQAHVVGHSAGGVIALQVALDAPEVVDSLILLEPPLRDPSRAEQTEARDPVFEQYHAGDHEAAVDGFLRGVVGDDWRTYAQETVPGGIEQAVRDAATFFEFWSPAHDDWEVDEERAEAFSRPVLYLRGSASPDWAKEASDLVQSWFPQTEEYVVEGLNHALQWQEPRPVAERIADFLRRHRS